MESIRDMWVKSQKAELDVLLNYTKQIDLEEGLNLFLKNVLPKINPIKGKDALLDVCCGPVSILKFLPKTRLMVAVDSNLDEYLNKFPREEYIIYKNMEAENLIIEDKIFDKVFCINAIDHTLDFRRVLSELFRVTKKNGTIVLTFENMNYMYKFFYWLGFQKLNKIHHPFTIGSQDIKNEIIKNIDSNAIFLVVPVFEKVTYKNIFNLFIKEQPAKVEQITARYNLPLLHRVAHYFILLWNRFFSFFFPDKHAYFIALIIKKSEI